MSPQVERLPQRAKVKIITVCPSFIYGVITPAACVAVRKTPLSTSKSTNMRVRNAYDAVAAKQYTAHNCGAIEKRAAAASDA